MMLILTRKPGEEIIVRAGEHVIRICLVEVRGPAKKGQGGGSGKARIGVQAADDVGIDRAEVDFAKEREKANRQATTAATATPA